MSQLNFIGNPRAIGYLKMIAQNQTPAQAYLFVGPAQIGKTTAAMWLAQALLCAQNNVSAPAQPSLLGATVGETAGSVEMGATGEPCGECLACRSVVLGSHPDFFRVETLEGKTQIAIEQVQNLKNSLALNPSWGKRRVVVLLGAEQLNQESGNCLLKTLEEPNGETIFIMVADDFKHILPTIISRCQVVRFFTVGKGSLVEWLTQSHGLANQDLAHELAGLSGGRPGKLLALLNSIEEQEGYRQAVRGWLTIFTGGLAENFKFLENIFGRQNFVASQKTTQEALEILSALLRDLFLAKMKVVGLINYRFLQSELETIARRISWRQIGALMRQLRQSKRHLLTSNANPRLILENLILTV